MKFYLSQLVLKFNLGVSLSLALLSNTALYAEVIDIDNGELQTLVANGTPVIDIRRPDEWQALGLVKDSHPITFFDSKGAYDARQWLDQASTLASKDQPIVLICLHGNRSKVVSNWLSDQVGYSKVYNVGKGIDHWIKEGNDTFALP